MYLASSGESARPARRREPDGFLPGQGVTAPRAAVAGWSGGLRALRPLRPPPPAPSAPCAPCALRTLRPPPCAPCALRALRPARPARAAGVTAAAASPGGRLQLPPALASSASRKTSRLGKAGKRRGCCGLESRLPGLRQSRSLSPGTPPAAHRGLALLLQVQVFSEPSGQTIRAETRYYYYHCYQRHCHGRWFYYPSDIASSDIYMHSLNCNKSGKRY